MTRRKDTNRVLAAAFAAGASCLIVGIAAADTAAPVVTAAAPSMETPAAHNGLTLTGAVGLPLNPTANIPNNGGVRIQADYFDLGDLDVDNNFGSGFERDQKIGDAKFYGVHAAGSLGKRAEISGGIDFLKFHGERNLGSDNDSFDFGSLDGVGFSVGAKYQAYHSKDGDTLIAVGAGYSRSLFRNLNAYVVGSKAFGVGRRSVTGHLGVRYDRFTIKGVDNYDGGDFSFDEQSSKVSVFAGAEVPLDKKGRFSLVGEIGTKNSEELDLGDLNFGSSTARTQPRFPYSASVRYARNGLAASIGVVRQGVTGDSGLFAQIGKTF